jgi:hypothetical protein
VLLLSRVLLSRVLLLLECVLSWVPQLAWVAAPGMMLVLPGCGMMIYQGLALG